MAQPSIVHDALLRALVFAASRPSVRCISRAAGALPVRKYASSSARIKTNPSTPRRAFDGRSYPPASDISLHVGLDRNPDAVSAISRIPIPRGERGEKFTPSPLSRPLGLHNPPQPGQNVPLDLRTLTQRAEDFSNYERAMTRRRLLLRSFFRPYFQERKRLDHHRGKSFVANERLFKKDKALHFPNIWGQTLSSAGDGHYGGRDTTPALKGKITVIGIQSGRWAEEQVDTFLSSKNNPTLHALLTQHSTLFQRADMNIQSNWFATLLVKLFKSRIRSMIPKDQWERYFLVKLAQDVERGFTEDIRDAMGLLNTQVGYVYLLDQDCRIRWAGSGDAWKGEIESLNSGIRKLLEDVNSQTKLKPNTFATSWEQPRVARPVQQQQQRRNQQPQSLAAAVA